MADLALGIDIVPSESQSKPLQLQTNELNNSMYSTIKRKMSLMEVPYGHLGVHLSPLQVEEGGKMGVHT